ncbi:hypothetical protein HK405_003492 [Cladochytrium tenue]|nr:hypothetical protein HK405_003492 [Cladochytrium tenue]
MLASMATTTASASHPSQLAAVAFAPPLAGGPGAAGTVFLDPAAGLRRVRWLPQRVFAASSAHLLTASSSSANPTSGSGPTLAVWHCRAVAAPQANSGRAAPGRGRGTDALADAAWTATPVAAARLHKAARDVLDMAVLDAPSAAAAAAAATSSSAPSSSSWSAPGSDVIVLDDDDSEAGSGAVGEVDASQLVFAATDDGCVTVLAASASHRHPDNGSTLRGPLFEPARLHRLHDGRAAACTGVAASAAAASEPAVVSVGEDGAVVFSQLDGRSTGAVLEADSAGLTAVRWRTPNDAVAASDSGRVRVADARTPRNALSLVELGVLG